MHKTRGEQHYLNQFKNTGKNQKRGARKQRRHVGNSNSMAGSRPSGMSIVNSRIVMAKYNQDIEQREVVDYKTEPEHAKQLYRKNNAPLLVSHRPFQPANRPPKIASVIASTKQNPIRIIHLEQIHPHLYLSNNMIFHDVSQMHKMNTIIDFSSRCVVWRQRDVWGFYDPANYLCATNRIFPIEWNDKQFVSYAELCQVLQRGIQIMANKLDSGPLLVVCDRGVNRSVSLAIAYAVKQLGWKFNDALNYIDQVKNTMYPRVWTSLSNHQIRRRLRNFEGTYRQARIQF